MSIHGGIIIIRGHLSVNTRGIVIIRGHLSVNTRGIVIIRGHLSVNTWGYCYNQGPSKCQYMWVLL